MQASWLGHSASLLHSTSGIGTGKHIYFQNKGERGGRLSATRLLLGCLTLCAGDSVGIPGVACVAGADALMVLPGTVGIDGAPARVHALSVSAGEGDRAVRVHQALVGVAPVLRVPVVVGRAVAPGPVVAGLTQRVDAARLERARILALPVDAGLVVPALEVILAPGYLK